MVPIKEQLEKAAEPGRLSRTQNVQPSPAAAEDMPNQGTATASHSRTYLDHRSKVNGKLYFEAPAQINGQIEGEIDAHDTSVMFGQSAVVTAKIKAVSVTVAGVVNGEISASERIELQPSAKVSGSITTPILVMLEGAQLEGKCTMQPKAAREDRRAETTRKEEHLATETKGQQPVGQVSGSDVEGAVPHIRTGNETVSESSHVRSFAYTRAIEMPENCVTGWRSEMNSNLQETPVPDP